MQGGNMTSVSALANPISQLTGKQSDVLLGLLTGGLGGILGPKAPAPPGPPSFNANIQPAQVATWQPPTPVNPTNLVATPFSPSPFGANAPGGASSGVQVPNAQTQPQFGNLG